MSVILAMAVQVAMVAAEEEGVKKEKGMKEKRSMEKYGHVRSKCCRYLTYADTQWNLHTCMYSGNTHTCTTVYNVDVIFLVLTKI